MKTLDLVNAVLGTKFLNEEEARSVLIKDDFVNLYNSATHKYTTFCSHFIRGSVTNFDESYELLEGVLRATNYVELKALMSHSLNGNITRQLVNLEGFTLPKKGLEDIPNMRPDESVVKISKEMNVTFDRLSSYYSSLLLRVAKRLDNYNNYLNDTVLTDEAFELIHIAFKYGESIVNLDNKLKIYIKARMCIKAIVLGLVRKPIEENGWFTDKQENILTNWYNNFGENHVLVVDTKENYQDKLDKLLNFKTSYITEHLNSCKTKEELDTVYNEYSNLFYNALGVALKERDLRLFSRTSFLMYIFSGYKRRRTFI